MSTHPSVIAAIRDAVEAAPEDVPLRLHLASLLLAAGEPAEALVQFATVLARDPVHLDALRGAAQAAEGAGEQTRAEGYRRLLTALSGDSSPRPHRLPETSGPLRTRAHQRWTKRHGTG